MLQDIVFIPEPRRVSTWEEFRREKPPYSIALDGRVSGPPSYDPDGPYANFDHHSNVDRLATRSTSGQVYMAVKQGLFNKFRENGRPHGYIYINDPDHDTSLAVWLLRNHERISRTRSEPLINRLVNAEDLLDSAGGTYPFDPEAKLMREIAWIFDPYTSVLHLVPEMDQNEMKNVVDAVGARIGRYTMGSGEQTEPDTRYQTEFEGTGWSLIKEIGPYARAKLFSAGTNAFVAIKEANGCYRYSLGKRSQFNDFPVEQLYDELNKVEGIQDNDQDRWGGSNIIGGSPRERGSSIPPAQLTGIVEEFLKKLRL